VSAAAEGNRNSRLSGSEGPGKVETAISWTWEREESAKRNSIAEKKPEGRIKRR